MHRRTDGRAFRIARVCGILFVLRSGIPWQMLPQELECGSGDLIHFALLDWLARRIYPFQVALLVAQRPNWIDPGGLARG
jgi:hypothetical protein